MTKFIRKNEFFQSSGRKTNFIQSLEMKIILLPKFKFNVRQKWGNTIFYYLLGFYFKMLYRYSLGFI